MKYSSVRQVRKMALGLGLYRIKCEIPYAKHKMKADIYKAFYVWRKISKENII